MMLTCDDTLNPMLSTRLLRATWLITALFVLFGTRPVLAHETRPAVLELTQNGIRNLACSLANTGAGWTDAPTWYSGFQAIGSCRHRERQAHCPNAQVSEFSMRLPKSGLANAKIEVVGLEQTLIDVLIRVTPAEGVPFRTILRASNASTIIPAEPTLWMVSTSYFRLGWDHILEGIDHLAFVLLVLLLARDSRSILSTVTAFTLAHSITLSAVTLGWASLPAAPVEAGIALSIVFLAAELATAPWSQHPTLTQTAAMVSLFWIRTLAWLWVCRCFARSWPSSRRHPDCSGNIQPGSRSGAVGICNDCPRVPLSFSIHGAKLASASLPFNSGCLFSGIGWYVLVGRTFGWLLLTNAN